MPAGWRATATALIELDGETLRERRKLMWNGSAAATLVIDGQGRPKADPVVSLRGIEDADGELNAAIVDGLKEMLADLSAAERRDDSRIEEAAQPGGAADRAGAISARSR